MRRKTAKEIHQGGKNPPNLGLGRMREVTFPVQEATFTGASSELPLDLDRNLTKLDTPRFQIDGWSPMKRKEHDFPSRPPGNYVSC